MYCCGSGGYPQSLVRARCWSPGYRHRTDSRWFRADGCRSHGQSEKESAKSSHAHREQYIRIDPPNATFPSSGFVKVYLNVPPLSTLTSRIFTILKQEWEWCPAQTGRCQIPKKDETSRPPARRQEKRQNNDCLYFEIITDNWRCSELRRRNSRVAAGEQMIDGAIGGETGWATISGFRNGSIDHAAFCRFGFRGILVTDTAK